MSMIPDWIWRDDDDRIESLSAGQLLFRRAVRIQVAVVRDIGMGQHGLYAASLVYTTLLALAPMLALCFSIIKSFGGADTLEPFLRHILSPLGSQGLALVPRLTEFVNNINVGVLGAVGLAFLIFSVLSLMQKVEEAFNHIWRVATPRSLGKRIRDHLSVLLIGPLFIFLSIGMTATLRYEDTLGRWLGIDGLDTLAAQALAFVPWVLFTLAFTALYVFMPNTRVRIIPALVAGALTALGWKVLGLMFSLFVAESANYAAIYSAFAALVLLMLWLYMAWLLVLAGSSVAYYLQYPDNMRLGGPAGLRPLGEDRGLALLLTVEIARRFYAHPQGTTQPRALAMAWHIPSTLAENVLARLSAAGIVLNTPQGYVPACPFDELTVAELIALIENCGEAARRTRWPSAIGDVLERMKTARETELGALTVKELGQQMDENMKVKV